MTFLRLALLALLLAVSPAVAQQAAPWHDHSPHKVQFVTVDKDVKLEVLDWGGTGRPVVLLPAGNTAHVFDDFAPKLTGQYHVYGITRRGYGASSAPAPDKGNYAADRLGDDVIAVLDALKLDRPVLVGHSIAGEQLSSIGSRHPERVAGLVYLDAGYSYAFLPAGGNDLTFDLADLENALKNFQGERSPREQATLVQQLLQKNLPAFEADLRDLKQSLDADPAEPKRDPVPRPTAEDCVSFDAYRNWRMRDQAGGGRIVVPDAELRQQMEIQPGGACKSIDHSAVDTAIVDGIQKYSEISAPVLAIFANPHLPGPFPYNTPAERAPAVAIDTKMVEAQAKAFQAGVPTARVVQIPHANHYIFISNEADVLREMRSFIDNLK